MKETVCTGCSLLCDDSLAGIEDGTLRSLGLCRLGHAHLEAALKEVGVRAKVKNGGKAKEVPLEDAIDAAAKAILESESLLVVGWSQASNEAIREGIGLTSDVGGFFDSTVSLGVAQAMSHELHSMNLEKDLEHIRNHGEFIVYWGVDPSESLHRHASRFAVLPRGEKIPEGFESRTIAVVDVRETETMKIANHRIVIPIGSDSTLLEVLANDISSESQISEAVLGIPASELIALSQKFQRADCTGIFYGSGLLNSGHAAENLEGLRKLVEAVRSKGKEAFAFPMPTETNAMGMIKELVDATSAPCAIDYSSGTGVHHSGLTFLQKLPQGPFTTALIVQDDILAAIPGVASRELLKAKTIYIGRPNTISDALADISINIPDAMLESGTTMERIDMVSIELNGAHLHDGTQPVLSNIIKMLREKIKERGRSN